MHSGSTSTLQLNISMHGDDIDRIYFLTRIDRKLYVQACVVDLVIFFILASFLTDCLHILYRLYIGI